MSRHSLAMEHVWQEDSDLLDISLMLPRQRCGLACLEMVIGYQLGKAAPAGEIFQRSKSYQAINSHNDWWHPGQVRVIASYGLTAWRRNWTAPTQDPRYFEENEGYLPDQMKAVIQQIDSEREIRSDPERFLAAVYASLDRGNPVIVSVKTGFSDNKENHQIVLSGYNDDELTFEIHDPVQKVGPAVVSEAHLLSYLNYWAIFSQK